MGEKQQEAGAVEEAQLWIHLENWKRSSKQMMSSMLNPTPTAALSFMFKYN